VYKASSCLGGLLGGLTLALGGSIAPTSPTIEPPLKLTVILQLELFFQKYTVILQLETNIIETNVDSWRYMRQVDKTRYVW